ncbi:MULTISPECIES: RagB/SusD family nutrient uptake outer membrane protein [Maribacter]|uniref:RagB/SusD family nutrient uptake outer membrane protein n=1 Tax=Maribacter flavus TaxID=1658664 RepID=A0A5B2TVV6_9FLAO|nr:MULTISPECIES: RagB/SusD family nutrient uptake outer membrane protein [Maribacter]KAA2218656.1 RagB/SusD family nutrient uptake outer membrane protein [Maribacter flavus]MDC6404671.1 RagB/SusD family nutrient uptake outer membrane protein [Maribacter sp. PR66]MEE1972085.1 RagB/SusD family nutrient uptake outer membrane protein [Maribacter flavus]
MKKRNFILRAVIAFLVIATGCSDDYLNREPEGRFSEGDVATPEGVEGLLIATYTMVPGGGLTGQTWHNDIHNWVFNIASDDALKGTDAGDQPEQSFIEAYDFQAFNVHIRDKWRGLYKGVAGANNVINTLALVEEGITDERRAQIVAEARFLRGLFHFEARKMWRMPVYISEENFVLNDLESTKIPNDREIWPLIEADFEAAAAVLPDTQGDVGRPTSWAAKAFLAKAKMYQGWDDNGVANTAKLGEAKIILDDIIDNGPFQLVDKFEDNFLVATRNNAESIFEVQYAINSATGDAANRGIGLAHPYTDPWGCCGFYQVSQNLVNAYQTENGLPLLETFDDTDVSPDTNADGSSVVTTTLDPRVDHTVGRPGILYKGFKIYQTDFVRDLSYAGPWFSMKHVAEPEAFGQGGWQNLSANNYRIMRLSMIYLWLAEAEVELGNLERARELVNAIRSRAANPEGFVPNAIQGVERNDFTIEEGTPAANYDIATYDDPWTDQDLARQAVRFETRLEFAMEGHRFFDLQRWGVSAEVLNAYIASESQHRAYLQGRSFTAGKHEFFPIPLEAIDRSALDGQPTLTQDPAY